MEKSKYRNIVYVQKSKKWKASIRVEHRLFVIGYFNHHLFAVKAMIKTHNEWYGKDIYYPYKNKVRHSLYKTWASMKDRVKQ